MGTMIVYFDESYDNARQYLLYGALFVPAESTLHRRFLEVRRELSFHPEVKYTKCRNPRAVKVYKCVVDAFIEDQAYFRCIVVDQHKFDYSGFARPDEPRALAKARSYKKFAEMLLHPNIRGITNAVLLADALTRCHGDQFLERIGERFNPPGGIPTFRHLAEVSSKIEEYQCLQVCDLLLGCVLNNLKPPENRFKTAIREYLCSRLNLPNLLYSTWKDVPLREVRAPTTKFNVWYWSAIKEPR